VGRGPIAIDSRNYGNWQIRVIPQSAAGGATVHSAGLISFGGILDDRRHAPAQGRQISFSWLFNGARHYPRVIMTPERRSALLSSA